jgi:cytochrome c oxidase cbb3-type subunit 1
VAVALLHIFNNLAVPISLTKSYSLFSGVQDAMTQWWYGHNAVGFFLTAAFLGMMYYFVPKQAGRPVYSYRLSIIHFWALIFLYMWAGGHHLHWTSLPDWVSTLAATFSVILLMPSWGGMINGIMTLSGAWDKLRSDPIMLFLITSLSFYGMSTFEGPLMSLKSVNALSHYTDWTVGHVHSGALGWVALVSFGSFYHLIPRLWETKMFSQTLIYVHFWLATIGIVLYITSMWVAGIGQGLMLRSFDDYGNLAYTFIETVEFMHTPYVWRALGGAFFVAGVLVMVYNMAMTLRTARHEQADVEAKLAAKLAKA